ncbi:MAG: hypothetical protein KME57_27065 [Scytonema hyalinum WJT4-NPBG1]|jgi:hypothetical protein|nr:hypothetical protein [Scytonema hyalinum WJT4-NPBG1]
MTHSRLRNENFSEHFEVTTQADSPSDSPINHALIAMAQEVAELLKTCLFGTSWSNRSRGIDRREAFYPMIEC